MKKILSAALVWAALVAPAYAANVNIDALPAAASVAGADLFECEQGGVNNKCTGTQINTYVQSLWGAGCATFLTTPSSANLRGCLTDEVGTGAFYTVGGALGTPASVTLTNGTGLPISTGLTGAGTGVLAALAANVGSAGAPVLFNGAGGTPSSLTLTNATSLPLAQLTGAGTGVLSALAAAMNSSTGPIGALTPTNGNCVTGNGTAWTSAACPSGTTGGNPTATAGPTAVNGVSTSFMRADGAPAIQQGSSSIKGIVQVDGTTITASGGVISAVGGGSASAVPTDQTGTNYAFQGTDLTKIVYLSNASNQIPTIAQAGTGSFTSGWYTTACNIGAGTQTITPTTSTIGGAATYVLPAGSAAAPKCIGIASDGTNYRIVPDYFRFGANVEAAAGLGLSAAGGLTTTVAAGTSALGTSAIASAACATAVTTTATNTATTDVIQWGFNGDPTAVTGYVPLVAGMLTIIAYPSANNVNFKVCNNTNASITPGAITLNWRVAR